jgi:leucyl aminopeptidase
MCCCPAPTAASPASCFGSARRVPAIRWIVPSLPSVALAGALPPGRYRLASKSRTPSSPAVARGPRSLPLPSLQVRQQAPTRRPPWRLPRDADPVRTQAIVEAVTLGRDLINTPASDLGPAELEDAARTLAARHGASISMHRRRRTAGSELPHDPRRRPRQRRAPRLIDISWGPAQASRVTLVRQGHLPSTPAASISSRRAAC